MSITLTFRSGPEYEQVLFSRDGKADAAVLVLDLRAVAKGEYRELARRGFQTIVLERTERCRRAGDIMCCLKLVEGLIYGIHTSLLGDEDDRR